MMEFNILQSPARPEITQKINAAAANGWALRDLVVTPVFATSHTFQLCYTAVMHRQRQEISSRPEHI